MPKQTDVSKNLAWKHCAEPPRVVTLCGSTRFIDQFFRSGWRETLAGAIVLSVGVVVDAEGPHQGEKHGVKDLLDEIHFRKIDLSDEILVLNCDNGYIGKSTQREIAYAMATDTPIRFLDDEAGERVLGDRLDDIDTQVRSFLDGKVPPLCVECGDKGEVEETHPDPDGKPKQYVTPCSQCDPTGGARQA